MATNTKKALATLQEQQALKLSSLVGSMPTQTHVKPTKNIGRIVADMEDSYIDHLWCDQFICGVATMIVGTGGVGKTTLMCNLIAHVTRGERFHDGTPCEKGGAVIAFMEDELTLKKRLLDANVDTKNVVNISTIEVDDIGINGSTKEARFCLPDHIKELEQAIELVNARIVVLDPLAAICPLYGNTQVARKVINQLNTLAYMHNCAIIIINHPKTGEYNRKNWTTAIAGSSEWFNGARMVKAIVRDDNYPQVCNMATIKTNLDVKPKMLQYTGVEENGKFFVQFIIDDNAVMLPQQKQRNEETKRNAILAFMLSQAPNAVSPNIIANRVIVNGKAIAYGTIVSTLARLLSEGYIEKAIDAMGEEVYGYYTISDVLQQKLIAYQASQHVTALIP